MAGIDLVEVEIEDGMQCLAGGGVGQGFGGASNHCAYSLCKATSSATASRVR
jgi:hypothetical protein